jgi:hypothetical protein
LLIALVAVLASWGLQASDFGVDQIPTAEAVVSPVPLEAPPAALALSLPTELGNTSQFKPADKPRIARKAKLKESMLSRSARNQMALLAVKTPMGTTFSLDIFGNQDGEHGLDDIDLHRSFSRPQVAKRLGQDDGAAFEVSEYAKLRLFLARQKAVEAFKLARVADAGPGQDEIFTDSIKIRLSLARMKAVQAHQKKFS